MAKRQHARYQKNLLVNISTRGFESLGLVMNVSLQGLCIESPEMLPPGTPLSLLLAVGNYLISVDGVVVWCKENPEKDSLGINGGMGVQLNRPPQEYIRYIAESAAPEQP
ncbi:MAG: PilZ domain-containing protein [Acidobacteriota bacterium]|jgi:hypothetical protein|nr:PilZ domain-containing protein [Acidobacteriota bacterium]